MKVKTTVTKKVEEVIDIEPVLVFGITSIDISKGYGSGYSDTVRLEGINPVWNDASFAFPDRVKRYALVEIE